MISGIAAPLGRLSRAITESCLESAPLRPGARMPEAFAFLRGLLALLAPRAVRASARTGSCALPAGSIAGAASFIVIASRPRSVIRSATVFCYLATFSQDGSIHFICMDWRHLGEILAAGTDAYTELKNLCVWVKDNGGMGSFYRSRHELVLAFKSGTAQHINSFELGQHGRYRTNVWQYRGMNTLGPQRQQELALHPTVKPVTLIADAIKDVSHRSGLVLDCFGGSGSTLIAVHKTGRRARLIELDPIYVDRIIRRWEAYAKDDAVLAETQQTYTEVVRERGCPN
jgi:hypothetical protein